jgi:hypothetical protein
LLFGAALALSSPTRTAHAQPGVDIPPSVQMEHESVLAYLQHIAERTTPSGKAAQRLLDVLRAHMANEEAFILPPLTLLPALAQGKVTPDMRWALAMSDRLAAEHDAIQRAHAAITEATVALQIAAEDEKDQITVGFARDVAADDLGDMEITEPTVLLIGETLRTRLPAQ